MQASIDDESAYASRMFSPVRSNGRARRRRPTKAEREARRTPDENADIADRENTPVYVNQDDAPKPATGSLLGRGPVHLVPPAYRHVLSPLLANGDGNVGSQQSDNGSDLLAGAPVKPLPVLALEPPAHGSAALQSAAVFNVRNDGQARSHPACQPGALAQKPPMAPRPPLAGISGPNRQFAVSYPHAQVQVPKQACAQALPQAPSSVHLQPAAVFANAATTQRTMPASARSPFFASVASYVAQNPCSFFTVSPEEVIGAARAL